MAIQKYEVQALFAEPIFRADIGHIISEQQIEFIKSLKMVNNQVNLISECLYLIASRVVVYEELKEAATVSLGKVGLRHQQNQEHHDDHQEHHYGTGRTR